MSPRTRIEEVLRFLGVDDPDLIPQLRSEGLFERDELEPYEAEELRVAALLVEELGVNPAGVEVALHLRRRLIVLQSRAHPGDGAPGGRGAVAQQCGCGRGPLQSPLSISLVFSATQALNSGPSQARWSPRR